MAKRGRDKKDIKKKVKKFFNEKKVKRS